MKKIIERLKHEYPMMRVVNEQANCDTSVKFNRYGLLDFDNWVAIKCGDKLEIYDQEGVMREVLDLDV